MIFVIFNQNKMDESEDQQLRPATHTGDGASDGQNQTIMFTEEEMAIQAQQNIQLRQKMAKLFQQYRRKW